jgi:vacuolar-type H+-ATPase subunit F/Vma7
MKKLLTIVFAVLSIAWAQAQNNAIDRFFNDFEDDPSATIVNISPKTFSMITKAVSKAEDAEIKDILAGIKGLKMISTQENTLKHYKDALAKIPTNEYETLVTVKDKGQNIRFLTKGTNDIVNELLLLVGGDKEFMVMSFVGNLDLNKIAKLANKLNIDGAEHLDKVIKK